MGERSEQTDLIINYLPQNLTDDEFKSMFLSIGPLQSCKIIRDHATNYSYGFGFVDYKDPEHARMAIDTLNGLELQNKRIKVAYSRKGDGVKGTNLYIRGLPAHYTQEDLAGIFGKFGRIVNCRVLVDQNTHQGRGVGFVLFSQRSEAETSIRMLNGKIPEGGQRPLNVQFAEEYTCKARQAGFAGVVGGIPTRGGYSRASPGGGGYHHKNNSSYGGGGSGHYAYGGDGAGSMAAYGGGASGYGTYGHQTSYYHQQPPHHHNSHLNRYRPLSGGGGGGASNVYYNNNGSDTQQQSAIRGGGGVQVNEYVLFVYNIGAHSDEGTLWELFGPFGHVTKVAVKVDQSTGQGKGYGFVTMTNYHQAQAAIDSLNGYRYMGRPLQVSFKS